MLMFKEVHYKLSNKSKGLVMVNFGGKSLEQLKKERARNLSKRERVNYLIEQLGASRQDAEDILNTIEEHLYIEIAEDYASEQQQQQQKQKLETKKPISKAPQISKEERFKAIRKKFEEGVGLLPKKERDSIIKYCKENEQNYLRILHVFNKKADSLTSLKDIKEYANSVANRIQETTQIQEKDEKKEEYKKYQEDKSDTVRGKFPPSTETEKSIKVLNETEALMNQIPQNENFAEVLRSQPSN